MRRLRILTCIVFAGLLTACSSAEERAAKAQQRSYEAQEKLVKQRLDFVAKYQKCVTEAGGDKIKVEACDSYLRSAEALK